MFIKKGSKISKDMITAKGYRLVFYLQKVIDLVLGLEAKTDIQEDTVLKKENVCMILIRCDVSFSIGTGHFYRMLNLANYLEKKIVFF